MVSATMIRVFITFALVFPDSGNQVKGEVSVIFLLILFLAIDPYNYPLFHLVPGPGYFFNINSCIVP